MTTKLTPMPEPRLPEGALARDWERYYVERDVALRERIAALAKYAEHNASCSRFTHISNPHLKRELAEKFKQALPDCTCGLAGLMDTLRGDGLI